jgi:hypothetical protein
MAHELLAIALSAVAAVAPVSAAQDDLPPTVGAPTAGPGAKYCLKVDPLTGSNIETIRCWTREKWAEQGVDVDKEWVKDGVRVIG